MTQQTVRMQGRKCNAAPRVVWCFLVSFFLFPRKSSPTARPPLSLSLALSLSLPPSLSRSTGRGECRYEDGSVYVGTWKQGKKDGRGTLTLRQPKSTVLTATPPLHEGNAAVAPLLDTALSTLKVSDAIAVYSGHFRDDTIGGTGTCAVKCSIPASRDGTWMVPLRMSDLQLIHVKAGFTADGQ